MKLEDRLNHYTAEVTHIVDGDTFDCTVDKGFNSFHRIRVRMNSINTDELKADRTDSPEVQEEKKLRALQAKFWLSHYICYGVKPETVPTDKFVLLKRIGDQELELRDAGAIFIKTNREDNLGRWLSDVWIGDDEGKKTINEEILESGLAVPFKKKSRSQKKDS